MSFHKMYAIPEGMYRRLLKCANDLERQELLEIEEEDSFNPDPKRASTPINIQLESGELDRSPLEEGEILDNSLEDGEIISPNISLSQTRISGIRAPNNTLISDFIQNKKPKKRRLRDIADSKENEKRRRLDNKSIEEGEIISHLGDKSLRNEISYNDESLRSVEDGEIRANRSGLGSREEGEIRSTDTTLGGTRRSWGSREEGEIRSNDTTLGSSHQNWGGLDRSRSDLSFNGYRPRGSDKKKQIDYSIEDGEILSTDGTLGSSRRGWMGNEADISTVSYHDNRRKKRQQPKVRKKRKNVFDQITKLQDQMERIRRACIDGLIARLGMENRRQIDIGINQEFQPIERDINDLRRDWANYSDSDIENDRNFLERRNSIERRINESRGRLNRSVTIPRQNYRRWI